MQLLFDCVRGGDVLTKSAVQAAQANSDVSEAAQAVSEVSKAALPSIEGGRGNWRT